MFTVSFMAGWMSNFPDGCPFVLGCVCCLNPLWTGCMIKKLDVGEGETCICASIKSVILFPLFYAQVGRALNNGGTTTYGMETCMGGA